MTTIFVFIAVFALLILAHELGHFWVARRNGVMAEEFGFGFPPRIIGIYRGKDGKRKWVWGGREVTAKEKAEEDTIYSFNLIPLGGFVKIKGEDGEAADDPRSFSAQTIWTRFKILSAGVMMNFILGAVLLTFAFWIGLPEAIDDNQNFPGAKIQITQVLPDSPAQTAGLKMGDELVAAILADNTTVQITSVKQFQQLVQQSENQQLTLKIIRLGETQLVVVTVSPQKKAGEEKALIGVALAKTAFVRHTPWEAAWLAIKATITMIGAILGFLGNLIAKVFTARPVSMEVTGPVGIAVLTGQAAKLGLAYVLQLAAILSINLGVINFLPFPALDGGRILFLLIEKIKGSPVSQKVEGAVHTAGFVFLLGIMLLVTVRDFAVFDLLDEIKRLWVG